MENGKRRKRGLNRPAEVVIAELQAKLELMQAKARGEEITSSNSSDPEMAKILDREKIAKNELAKLIRHRDEGQANHDNMILRAEEWLVKAASATEQIPLAELELEQIRSDRDTLIRSRITQTIQA